MQAAGTDRKRAKALRRDALLTAAARLFAAHGYDRVSIEDLGAAAGVSGPALYRHFEGKQAVLAAILVGESDALLAGGHAAVELALDPRATLERLIASHLDFALAKPDVIRVQVKDLDSLPEPERHAVRAAQRTYVELWVSVLQELHPGASAASLRMRAHAVFGLLNSTPHSGGHAPGTRVLLEQMALDALLSEAPG